ncbi:MAG: LON peptidase substrate-binding domain-containing protein [Pyrinomonadaceae bacterium]
MSEASEKVAGVEQIPIFPLPLVLLPGELLPLHIFEPRYRRMLEDIQLERNLFGVLLFDPQESMEAKPAPGIVGCVAEIRESHTLPDGRSNILSTGIIRFRIREYVEADVPYLVGRVAFFEDEPASDSETESLVAEVSDLFERVAKAAFKISGSRGRFPEIPKTSPEQLSFLITAAFNLDIALKYELLEMTSTFERLNRLKTMLAKTVDKMEENAELTKLARSNGHGTKNIDT